MPKKIKKNITAISRKKGKVRLSQAGLSTDGNNDKKRPVFSFHQMQEKHYCLDACNDKEKISLIRTLDKLSQSTCQELKNVHRHKLGAEKINYSAIKGCPVPDFIIEQNITLLAFRFCSKKPMVGYREGQIYHILWLDRDYSLYQH
ncbi:MAG: hypothetical protein GKC53_00185 [Neisseriaceae bacterium]|nr:MAG: hypothetical protein GKC53_00185 [Neisseriaceae bacterium]